jgi:hypothetical protein
VADWFGQQGQQIASDAVAGMMGGAVASIVLGDNARGFAARMIVGTACAVYLGPAAAGVFSPLAPFIGESGPVSVSGFLMGIGGIIVIGAVLDMARKFRRDRKDESK